MWINLICDKVELRTKYWTVDWKNCIWKIISSTYQNHTVYKPLIKIEPAELTLHFSE